MDTTWIAGTTSADDLEPWFEWADDAGAPKLTFRLISPSTDARLEFLWWDDVDDVLGFLEWLRTAQDGDRFCDLEQGWGLEAIRARRRLHFRGFGWTGAVEGGLDVDRAALIARIDGLEQKMSVARGA